MIFIINSGATIGAKAEVYSLQNNEMSFLGETKLDSHITSYTKIQTEFAEDDVRVYADALGSDGHSMLTEVIYWSNTYDTIISPFYSYNSGRTSSTSRDSIIPCCDMNSDGLIDIPVNIALEDLPEQISAVNWKNYKSTTLVNVGYSLFAEQDDYFVNIPEKQLENISVYYDDENREMTITNTTTKNLVVSVKPVLKEIYNDTDYQDYTVVLEKSGYYYLAKLGSDKDINITIEDLKQSFESLN